MHRLFIVLATVTALLACPWQCLPGCAHAADDADECCHDEACHSHSGESPRSPDAPAPHEDGCDDGCACLCCSGALPKADAIAPVGAELCMAIVAAPSDSNAGTSLVAHRRWRLLAPDSDPVSGRALRVRMASYLI